jgi:transcriptional regulator with XRE-family HTH domain
MDLRLQFGQRLQHLRQAKGLTQANLAEQVGVTVEFISLLERGVNAPSFETLEKLARALQMPVYQLFLFEKGDNYVVD